MSFESSSHLCSHRGLDRREILSKIFLCIKPSMALIALRIESRLLGLAVKAFLHLVPGNLSALLPVVPHHLCPQSHSYFLCFSLSHPTPPNISALLNSYSTSKPQLK